jgi:uncharacterized membrane protein SpoIIM required for sporulation
MKNIALAILAVGFMWIDLKILQDPNSDWENKNSEEDEKAKKVIAGVLFTIFIIAIFAAFSVFIL